MAQCPKCGSSQISFSREYTGSTGTTKYYRHRKGTSRIFSAGRKTSRRTSHRETIALCKACGYTWNTSQMDLKTSLILFGIALLMMYVGGHSLFDSSGTKKTVEVSSKSAASAQAVPGTNVGWTYPALSDFSYEFENEGITLTKYNGRDTAIVVPATYDVENNILPVLELDNTFKNNSRLVDIAISEGIQTMLSDTFYGCDRLKHVYIPASVTNTFGALRNFSGGEILYYGGDEAQWDSLRDGLTDRSQIAFKEIVLNANLDDCLKNLEKLGTFEDTNEYTPLSDFRFDATAEGLILKGYKGKEDRVIIAPAYEIDGKVYDVRKLDNTFALHKVNTVVLPEGVEELTQAVFNTSGIQKLYLPKSLMNVPGAFWKYFHNVDTIWYGGTEEDFDAICSVDRFDIDVLHMIYEATPDMVIENVQ